MNELKITNEDIELLKEMKTNCLNSDAYDDDKRLLKANAITKFLKLLEEKEDLIKFLKKRIDLIIGTRREKGDSGYFFGIQETYEEILDKVKGE